MDEIELTAKQELEAQEIEDVLKAKMAVGARGIARLLASKSNGDLFGETEFQVRNRVHSFGARALEAALHERKKGGTAGPA